MQSNLGLLVPETKLVQFYFFLLYFERETPQFDLDSTQMKHNVKEQGLNEMSDRTPSFF